jgi:hypothetical protein
MSNTTTATIALGKLGIDFELRLYRHDTVGPKAGLQAADVLGEPLHVVLKTLMLQMDGRRVCVLICFDTGGQVPGHAAFAMLLQCFIDEGTAGGCDSGQCPGGQGRVEVLDGGAKCVQPLSALYCAGITRERERGERGRQRPSLSGRWSRSHRAPVGLGSGGRSVGDDTPLCQPQQR